MSNFWNIEITRRRLITVSLEALGLATLASCLPEKPDSATPAHPETVGDLTLDVPTLEKADDHTYVINACSHGQPEGVTLRTQIKAVGDTDWKTLKELGVPCFSNGAEGTDDNRPRLFTQDFSAGEYQIRVLANPDTIKDPQWSSAASQIIPFTLTK